MEITLKIILGLAGSAAIGGMAYRRRSLSKSGFAAAVLLGTVLYTAGSLAWYGTLIAFFISSTLLSRLNKKHKQEAEQHYEKGGRRDAGQVLANGGLPLIFAIGNAWFPHILWWYAFLGALAAVNADTWATELGALSRRKPRSILNGKRVEPGTSGGVTASGLAASLAGGCFIGLSAYLLSLPSGMVPGSGAELSIGSGMLWIMIGGAAGLFGSLFDSLLGATLQANYRCSVCGRIVEKEQHCGRQAEPVRGWRMMRNDQVNAAASLSGAVTAMLLGLWI